MTAPHLPIMVHEIMESLRVQEVAAGRWIDGTLGAGGHSHAILGTNTDHHLMGMDLDPRALAIAADRLRPFGDRAHLVHASYEGMQDATTDWLGPTKQVDGILLDLGLSSMQLDTAERGFSFRQDAPLDMRFDPTSNRPTAADLLNTLPADELADLIYHYGEDRNSRRIARAIVAQRPIQTTGQLADLIKAQQRGKPEKIHPATRTFQALRIAVNDELGAVERILPIAIDLLKPGGRFAVITFHSLEDRLVKQAFKLAATDCICPPRQPICTCDHHASVGFITRKPRTPGEDEIEENPRARSAKLRVVEKLPHLD